MEPITMLTCYDASFARILTDTESVDYILVGDSAANVVYGHERTLGVDLPTMIRHVEAVRKGIDRSHSKTKPILVADLPAGSYETPEIALPTAIAMKSAGAEIVKIEGPLFEVVSALRSIDTRVCGHLGYTPQSITEAKVQGRSEIAAEKMKMEAKALQKFGCELLVLELIPAALAGQITLELKIPTIGIGAGPSCSGQVLVLYDLLGFDPDFNPKFLKKFSNGYDFVSNAVKAYSKSVREKSFPSSDQSFS